jgi:hypothetical protein
MIAGRLNSVEHGHVGPRRSRRLFDSIFKVITPWNRLVTNEYMLSTNEAICLRRCR